MTQAVAPRKAREPLATAQEVADYLGVPLNTLYMWRHRSKGPRMRRVGRHLRARWVDVERWLDSQGGAA